MAAQFKGGRALDINLPTAFAFISGAISGVTPKVSAWIRLVGVDTFAPVLSTTSTANGLWTAKVATGPNGENAKALPNPPTFPTGAASSGTPVITMPQEGFNWLQITFTPSAGAGNANANAGQIVGVPFSAAHGKQFGAHVTSPASGTLAGSHVLEASGNWDGVMIDGGPIPHQGLHNTPTDPAFFFDLQQGGSSIASLTSGGQNLLVRCGLFEFAAARWTFLPASGFGTLRVFFNSKG